MSYCVNCGVELAASEKSCPLCGVEVINPRQPYQEPAERPYSQLADPAIARSNHRFIAAILSISLGLPAALTLVINLTHNRTVSWSLYVAGALGMLWVWIVPPLLYRRSTFLKNALADAASVAVYLWLIESLQTRRGWYWPLALPLVGLVSAAVIAVTCLAIRRHLRSFQIPAAILTAVGLVAIGIEVLVDHFAPGKILLFWSWFVLIPCLGLAAASLAISRRQKMRDEILKRLHL